MAIFKHLKPCLTEKYLTNISRCWSIFWLLLVISYYIHSANSYDSVRKGRVLSTSLLGSPSSSLSFFSSELQKMLTPLLSLSVTHLPYFFLILTNQGLRNSSDILSTYLHSVFYTRYPKPYLGSKQSEWFPICPASTFSYLSIMYSQIHPVNFKPFHALPKYRKTVSMT